MITFANISTNTSTTPVNIPTSIRRAAPQRVLQVDITGTMTVAVEGRLSPSVSWTTLFSTSASAVTLVGLMAQMRIVTTNAAGTASVYLDAEQA